LRFLRFLGFLRFLRFLLSGKYHLRLTRNLA